MKISRNNYEIFFIDYLDNNLDQASVSELMNFLLQNPDLEAELYEMKNSNLSLINENYSFSDKNLLKKNAGDLLISNENFNDLCIAKLENELNDTDYNLFSKYLTLNPDKFKQYKLFELTKLMPDLSIEFENKNSLKRYSIEKVPIKSWTYRITTIAAVIILIFITVKINNFELGKLPKYSKIHNAHIFNFIPQRNNINNFSIINTETPDLISKNMHLEKNNTSEKNQYQYVDYKNAGFVSDFIKNMRSVNSQDNDQLVSGNAFKSAGNHEKTYNSSITEESLQTLVSSPGQVILLNGEVRNNDMLNSILAQMDNKLPDGNLNEKPVGIITFWDVADAGIRGYSKLSGKKIDFHKELDENGRVKSLAINSGKFQFSRK
ncbi:MAG: hypothetical protein ABIJ97_00875 [Bacteroidota bacterium]